jgi:hypothetical protein
MYSGPDSALRVAAWPWPDSRNPPIVTLDVRAEATSAKAIQLGPCSEGALELAREDEHRLFVGVPSQRLMIRGCPAKRSKYGRLGITFIPASVPIAPDSVRQGQPPCGLNSLTRAHEVAQADRIEHEVRLERGQGTRSTIASLP